MVHNLLVKNIKHFLNPIGYNTAVQSAPYHPATHGAAERLVQALKRGIILGRKDRWSDNTSWSIRVGQLHKLVYSCGSNWVVLWSVNLWKHCCREVLVKQSFQKKGHDQHCHTHLRRLSNGLLLPKWSCQMITWRSYHTDGSCFF